MLSVLYRSSIKLCIIQYNKIVCFLHLIVVPKLSCGWQHNYSTKTRQSSHANEQSMDSLMSNELHRQAVGACSCIHNTSFSLLSVNGSNKLECYTTLGLKAMSGTNTPTYWSHLQFIKKMKCCKYDTCITNIFTDVSNAIPW